MKVLTPYSLAPPSRIVKVSEFFDLFTPDEIIAILTVRATNSTVDYFMTRVENDHYINLDDQRVIDGLTTLETLGLLAAGRSDVILA